NKLGNHIGNEFLKIRYNNERWGAEFYYDHIFEDGSGEKFRNRPDGLYGLYFTRKKNFKWFKSFVYEFYYTKCQSGPFHNDPVSGEVVGGNDNYFNNGIYQSGWTFYGQVIGSPFFTPKPEEASGITRGVLNNRFYAHHLGICGDLPGDIRYKLMMSYSLNYGTHSVHFINKNGEYTTKPQFSWGLELIAPDTKLPFHTALNVGFDKGDLLKNSFGIMLKIFKTGFF
ncbi:MAG: capsule assembly Wzi family protein, partial [Odoribacter splanchnicus]